MDRVVILVADDHLDDLPRVLAALREAGLVVDQVQGLLGTVTGSIPAEAISVLADIPGVAAVEPERPYQLPDPEADIQ